MDGMNTTEFLDIFTAIFQSNTFMGYIILQHATQCTSYNN